MKTGFTSWWLCGLIIGFSIAMGSFAAFAPVTHDEFFTLYLAQLPSLSLIYSALLQTIDFHPPLHFVLTRLSLSLFGTSAFSLRLVSVVCGLGFLCGLYRIVTPRLGRLAGILVVLVPCATHSYHFFFTARSYTLMLCLVTWAYYFWLQQERGKGSATACGVLLFLATQAHYYAVLAFIPVGLAELTILIFEKRRRLRSWMAMIIPAFASAAILFPLASGARGFSGSFWGHGKLSALFESYQFFLGESALWLWAALGIWLTLLFITKASRPRLTMPLSFAEQVLFFSTALLPIVGISVSVATGAGFTYRYVLIAMIGLAPLVAILLRGLFPSRLAAISCVLALSGWVVLLWTKDFRWMSAQSALIAKDARSLLLITEGPTPIVIGHYDIFMQYHFYAAKAQRDRFKFIHSQQFVANYLEGKNCVFAPEALLSFSKTSVDPSPFMASHPVFYCLLSPHDREAQNLLKVVEKDRLDWKVGDYQLYRCHSSAIQPAADRVAEN